MSLANLASSFVLIAVAGVTWFGVYSFILVFSLLAHQSAMSLLHGQMTLRISGKPRAIQNATLRATTTLNTVFFISLAALGVLAAQIPVVRDFLTLYPFETLAAVAYTFLLSSFELSRRFLYVLARQDLALKYTTVYATCLTIGLALTYFNAAPDSAIVYLLISHCISLIIGVASNSVTVSSVMGGRALTIGQTASLFQRLFTHGRFGFLGMLITWAQNQSLTPILMWAGGATVVGQFNIARLLTMPIVVLNAGITNSAIPKLREAFQKQGRQTVRLRTQRLALNNFLMCLLYLLGLLALHFSSLLARFVPDYNHVKVYLILWSLVAVAIMLRTWLTQYFAVALQFRFLLMASCTATAVSLFLMMAAILAGASHHYLPLCILGGEIVLYVVLATRQRRELHEAVSA